MTETVIVTGSTSFVGCHLARAFAGAGHAVTATHSRPVADYDGVADARLRWVSERAETHRLDITDGAAVTDLARRVRPALWVHHAGYATNYGSTDYDRAQGDAVNVAPLDAIFAAMADTGGGVLITGSNAEYADGDAPAKETDACRPSLPYGQSKLAETERAQALSEQTGVPARVGRLFIPFGRLDNPAKLLASAQKSLAERRPIDLSQCEQRRDFIGIRDVCDAWVRMAADLSRGGFGIFNICSGEATPLKTLLIGLAGGLGADPALLRFGAQTMRPGEPLVAYGDNVKARRVLGWSPRPLEQAIREDLIDDA